MFLCEREILNTRGIIFLIEADNNIIYCALNGAPQL